MTTETFTFIIDIVDTKGGEHTIRQTVNIMEDAPYTDAHDGAIDAGYRWCDKRGLEVDTIEAVEAPTY